MRLAHSIAIALTVAATVSAFSINPTFAADEVTQPSAIESYIVKFHEAGLLYYDGGLSGMRATSPQANGQRKLDSKSPAAVQYRDHLKSVRASHMNGFLSALNRAPEVEHDYDVMYNGMALQISAAEAETLRGLDFVQSVSVAGVYQLATDAGPAFIGAPAIWDGSAVFGGAPNRGEGVVVGVLDTGANSDHPSFANDATCGFNGGNPKLLSAVDCFQAACVGGEPEDVDATTGGHGVHTASTAAGNMLTPPLTVNGVDLPFPISGVAPCANVRSYKVCDDNGCTGAALIAAMQAAIVDQVDVINYSISGGRTPWSDLDRTFLDMVNADIYVAASAGNTRPPPGPVDPIGEVNHRGPWVMTVAASTHDRIVAFDVDVAGGPQDSGGVPGTGIDFPSGATTAEVASAAQLGNETGCTDTGGFDAGTMTGRIALISRGACGFLEKVDNATAAGAIAAIVYNNAPGPAIAMGALEATTIPSAMVPNSNGIAIRDFLVGSPAAQMTVTGPASRILDPAFGDILAAFSLRGPQEDFDVTKPDITGPGVNVFAAVGTLDGEFGFISGTSMSSPHLAGAGALIRSANPTWTPMEVKSAIQLTASRDGFSDDGATPWHTDEIGNGRVDLNNAAVSGLVMDESFANFLAADPSTGGNPRTLNLPSMRRIDCPGQCAWTRTVRNTLTDPSDWTVSSEAPAGVHLRVVPDSFSFTGNVAESQQITIYATMLSDIVGVENIAFGRVNIASSVPLAPEASNGGGQPPEASMTVAITGTQAPGAPTADLLLIDGMEEINE